MKSLYSDLRAGCYDLAMQKVERLCLKKWRNDLLKDLQGDVLEIGAGTGLNLRYYPRHLKQLVLCEPDAGMRNVLMQRLNTRPDMSINVLSCKAEKLDIADNSIDYLVSTLVFCSVDDQTLALNEAMRVLRPGGKLVLIEHVAAALSSRLYFWQRFWQPLWRYLACNCHLTRQTAMHIEKAGFVLCLRTECMHGAPLIASPLIVGHALRP